MKTYARSEQQFVRGSGVHLFDAEGHAYLDFLSGIGVTALPTRCPPSRVQRREPLPWPSKPYCNCPFTTI